MKSLSSKSWISRCAFLHKQGANTYFYSNTKLHKRWHYLLWLKKALLYLISLCSYSWITILLLMSLKYITGDSFFSEELQMLKYIWNRVFLAVFFPLAHALVYLYIWVEAEPCITFTMDGLCQYFAPVGVFPLVKKKLSRKETPKQALGMVLFVASMSGDSISSFFCAVFCFTLCTYYSFSPPGDILQNLLLSNSNLHGN